MAEHDAEVAEERRRFSKELQNVPQPVNDTSTSPEMQKYLDDMNSGKHAKQEREKKAAAEKKRLETAKTYGMLCPQCRQPCLKKAAGPNLYKCGHCGLESNNPIYIKEAEKK